MLESYACNSSIVGDIRHTFSRAIVLACLLLSFCPTGSMEACVYARACVCACVRTCMSTLWVNLH